jgi:hypothetical protein
LQAQDFNPLNSTGCYGIYACNGILFNHESPLRGETFVTRKITRALARIKLGLQDKLYLRNLDSLRDWGHARDYVEMQWRMLQQEKPEDFVIATGMQHSVREFVTLAAEVIGIKLRWKGQGVDEVAMDQNGSTVIAVDPLYFRPTEVETLLGDPSYAHVRLGWKAILDAGRHVRWRYGIHLSIQRGRARHKKRLGQVMREISRWQGACPSQCSRFVYDLSINERGLSPRVLTDETALRPDGYYTLMLTDALRKEQRAAE